MYLLPLLVAVIYCSLCHCQVITEPNCERPLFNLSELQQNPNFTSLASGFIGSTELVNFNLTCLAQGSTQGLYRATSVIVDVRKNSGKIVRKRFQLMCYDDKWRQPHIDSFETVWDLNLDPPIRYDCGSCHIHANNEYNCIECDVSCSSTGLGRCTNVAGDECCSAFYNGICVAEYPTNSTYMYMYTSTVSPTYSTGIHVDTTPVPLISTGPSTSVSTTIEPDTSDSTIGIGTSICIGVIALLLLVIVILMAYIGCRSMREKCSCALQTEESMYSIPSRPFQHSKVDINIIVENMGASDQEPMYFTLEPPADYANIGKDLPPPTPVDVLEHTDIQDKQIECIQTK